MSRHSIIAKRYAKALYEVASANNQSDAVELHLEKLVDLLKNNQELSAFIENPNVESVSKAEVIKQLLGEDMPVSLYNAVRLLLDRDRDWIFPDLFHAYVYVANEAQGKAVAEVSAPYALSDKEQQQIADAFAKVTGKQIQIRTKIDESLLGGITVQIGDRLYDGSMATKLKRLENELNSTQVV